MIKKVEHFSRLQFIQETVTVFFSKVNFALRCSNKRPSFLNLYEINDSLHLILVGEACAITLSFTFCKQKKYEMKK